MTGDMSYVNGQENRVFVISLTENEKVKTTGAETTRDAPTPVTSSAGGRFRPGRASAVR